MVSPRRHRPPPRHPEPRSNVDRGEPVRRLSSSRPGRGGKMSDNAVRSRGSNVNSGSARLRRGRPGGSDVEASEQGRAARDRTRRHRRSRGHRAGRHRSRCADEHRSRRDRQGRHDRLHLVADRAWPRRSHKNAHKSCQARVGAENAKGGVNGRKINVQYIDDQSSGANLTAAQDLVQNRKVVRGDRQLGASRSSPGAS